ncbi:MAG: tetratricopeptide repeat protein [Fibromonadaceae bacterium]|jgi:tol-pal system protein YbgF|nr:tetratricopeptide repeat protein [Fibromonadaceae bacterium]
MFFGREKNFYPIIAAVALVACAPTEKSIPANTGVDMFKVEATANEALNLAKADSAQIASLAPYLEFMSKRIDLLDSITSTLPLAAASENQLQIALLREEVLFLRKFLENQNMVPLINPRREQAPKPPSPLPPEYEQAQYLFAQKKYDIAAKEFEKVTVLYPKSDWADDAWYWAGEAQMALGNYAQAISAFEKVFFYPESIKQADAQFQIGICLLRTGNGEMAKAAFRKVQEFYPKSPRALQAQTELNKLK